MSALRRIAGLTCRSRRFWKTERAKRRVQRAYDAGWTVLPFGPWAVNLIMVDACNSHCIMCGGDYRDSGSATALSLAAVQAIYRHLPMDGVVQVTYGGGGEPFLNPDLVDIARHTRRVSPVIQQSVITNLIDAPETKCAGLLENDVHFLISINAATRDTYRTIAGSDRFGTVLENVKRLVRLRRDTGSASGIGLSIVLMRQNVREVPDLVEMASAIGVDSVRALYARIYPEEVRRRAASASTIAPEDSTFFHQAESDACLRKAEEAARSLGVKLKRDPLFAESRKKARDCRDPWQTIFVNYNGNVYPCPGSEVLFRRKIENGIYESGNIIEQPLMEFWNNAFWQSLRRTNRQKGREEIVPECLCCGNSLCWLGPNVQHAHVLDWSTTRDSEPRG